MTRRLVAGFLAGASSLVGILAILVLLLFIAGFWELLESMAIQGGSFWPLLGQALLRSIRALPNYLWSARWGMVALGLVGIVLVLVDAQRVRIHRPWRNYLGFVTTLGLVTAIVVGFQYSNREALTTWIADQPILFDQQAVLLMSHTTLLVIGMVMALAFAYVMWAAWNWWYNHWTVWLGVARTPAQPAATAPPQPAPVSEAMAYQERRRRLRHGAAEDEPPSTTQPVSATAQRSWLRGMLAGLVLSSLVVLGLLRLYDTVGPGVMSGGVWLSPNDPQAAVRLSFRQAPRRIALSNTAGAGVVDAELSSQDGGQVAATSSLQLAGTATRFETADLALAGLAPGTYRLELVLREGDGGLVRYVALYGGGLQGQLAAAALGLAMGVWVACAVVLLLEVLSEYEWIQ